MHGSVMCVCYMYRCTCTYSLSSIALQVWFSTPSSEIDSPIIPHFPLAPYTHKHTTSYTPFPYHSPLSSPPFRPLTSLSPSSPPLISSSPFSPSHLPLPISTSPSPLSSPLPFPLLPPSQAPAAPVSSLPGGGESKVLP